MHKNQTKINAFKIHENNSFTSSATLLVPGIYRFHTVTSIFQNFEFEALFLVNSKVLASNPRFNHATALFGTDGQNYLFKDSGPGKAFELIQITKS